MSALGFSFQRTPSLRPARDPGRAASGCFRTRISAVGLRNTSLPIKVLLKAWSGLMRWSQGAALCTASRKAGACCRTKSKRDPETSPTPRHRYPATCSSAFGPSRSWTLTYLLAATARAMTCPMILSTSDCWGMPQGLPQVLGADVNRIQARHGQHLVQIPNPFNLFDGGDQKQSPSFAAWAQLASSTPMP
mgnify:CR=1 FL=1